ncbi:hypothetical protein AQUCO_03000199v1 [Aquilegia coerulea]|uniref:Uncharacterized protein n=1 Tax=Aquilegia coerulea TaxID=218851 RepID=A0A2G5D1Q8_AQUCA|nr:hypothetical protein AQUCO_03000199v1 [Aquilegia coerulea]
MDINMITKSGAKSLVIGFASFAFPLIITMPVAFIVKSYLTSDTNLGSMLPYIALTESQTSFHVIFSLLADLKLLNSEIGRLAMSSSMISNVFCFITLLLKMTLEESFQASSSNWSVLKVTSIVCMVMVVMYIMRPIMLWIVRQTPEGSSNVKEVHVLLIFLMVLATSFFGQVVGQPVLFGPMILGLAVPPGPPLGTTLQSKLDSVVSSILLPLYYVGSVGRTDRLDITATGLRLVMLIAFLAFLGKLIGAVLPSMYCEMPFQDALALGLIMGSQGLVDLHLYRRALFFGVINNGVYTIMIYCSVVIAGTTSIWVKFMYRPSRRYMLSKSTLQQNINSTEFRILACVYRESNAPTIIEILEASNPVRESPIGVYLLHLIELQRIATPLLIAHRKNDTYSIHYNRSRRIINAFNLFEKQNQGLVSLMSFTAMSPYGSMHDDICSLAVDRKTSLIILPFHKQRTLDGLVETNNSIRSVNRNVLQLSPCSVGILIDRGDPSTGTSRMLGTKDAYYNIAIIFLGGADDREVLTYAMRMGDHPHTTLTVIRFRPADDKEATIMTKDKRLDTEIISEYKHRFMGNDRMSYREEVVNDGIGIITVTKAMGDSYDLIMVGRQHSGRESDLVNKGLVEWNEYPELGFLGDMFATSESQTEVSILVLQQHCYISEDLLHGPDYV